DGDEIRTIALALGLEVDGLGTPTILHTLWLQESGLIASTIDNLVRLGELVVPLGEVRRPRLGGIVHGTYRLRTEVAQYGVRQSPTGQDLPLLRLARLIEKLYDTADVSDRDELLWQLRPV